MNEINDKISVIIPVYNVEKYIEKCINSIINQTYANLEIILIDDGSSDNSGTICDKFAQIDKRIKVIHKINKGVSDTRNLGLKVSTGKYISFVDPDDYLDINAYSVLIENMKELSLDICAFNYNIVEDAKCKKSNVKNVTNNFINDLAIKKGIDGYVFNKMYSKDLIGNIQFDSNVKIMEDLLFNIVIATHKKNIKYKFINRNLYYYVQRENSILHTYDSNRIDNLFVLEKIICETKKFQEVSDYFKLEYIKTYYDIYYNYSKDTKFKEKNEHFKNKIESYKRITLNKKFKYTFKQKIIYFMVLKTPSIYLIEKKIQDQNISKN